MSDDEYRVAVEDGIEFPVPADGERWAVGAVILNRDGAAFAQRRGPGRRLFPDCWDIVGGHVEPGESLLDTLAREVAEETGRHLRRVRRHLGTSTPLTAGSAPTTSPASRRTGPPVSTSSTT
ncbi:NUDIX domain-containing protein [Streptomyces sp. 135]|uniref:NUDIX hydrolase n=1 Tax=Streptomyces sp. 135 TaxID=2838850 RepID=UPI001CBAD6E9|nr:NUDIX domain-containing protein [Streptomyces sp. 135]